MGFNSTSCKLNTVYFLWAELSDFKFDKNLLQNVYFSLSLFKNVKIKSSTLENIKFVVTYRQFGEN